MQLFTTDSAPAATDLSNGIALHNLIRELVPFCRSITGDGVRRTLAALSKHVPISIYEIPSGTQVLDWTVPREWNIRDAYVADAAGNRVIDFQQCPLHVMGYSTPVDMILSLAELRPHLFTDPARRQWIPFRYSYYNEAWGFCLSQEMLDEMTDGSYRAVIDSSLEDGSLTYGECFIQGATDTEVLVSVHTCHPWMCNDNLSGIVVACGLIQELLSRNNLLSYRFVFIPTTIGSITWLSQNLERLDKIKHGVVLTCIGDAGNFTYKLTRDGDRDIDEAFRAALASLGKPHKISEFSPFGFDERQYSSPGFNLPVGCLMRTPHGAFPEYHSSADNLEFVRPDSLEESLQLCLSAFEILETNRTYRAVHVKGEPCLAKHGIEMHDCGLGATSDVAALAWVLDSSDGNQSLLDIAKSSGISFFTLRDAAQHLLHHELIAPQLDQPSLS